MKLKRIKLTDEQKFLEKMTMKVIIDINVDNNFNIVNDDEDNLNIDVIFYENDIPKHWGRLNLIDLEELGAKEQFYILEEYLDIGKTLVKKIRIKTKLMKKLKEVKEVKEINKMEE